MIIIVLVILTIAQPTAWCQQHYNPDMFHIHHFAQYTHALERMILSMRTYLEDGIIRVREMNSIRWTYEDSVEYEYGYIMGDIIERYKKLIEEVTRSQVNADYNHRYITNDLFALISKLENVQKLYFEIYHLVRMLHEVPIKFRYKVVTLSPDFAAIQHMKDLEEARRQAAELIRLREKKRKEMRKQRQAARTSTTTEATTASAGSDTGTTKKGRKAATTKTTSTEKTSRPYNVWWPLDYGWELDAYGW